jgi:hypothetical protein
MNQPFNFPDGRVANDAKDLLELCEQYPDDATGFLVRQDLENWLAYIGDYEAAECAAIARQTDIGDRQKLEEFIHRYHSLTAPNPVPEAVSETNLEDNLTAPESAAVVTEIPEKRTVESSVPATDKSLEAPTPPNKPTSLATEPSTQKPIAQTPVNSNSVKDQEKPSFFQVVAKLFVKIFNA